jgi:hypothetical protein
MNPLLVENATIDDIADCFQSNRALEADCKDKRSIK